MNLEQVTPRLHKVPNAARLLGYETPWTLWKHIGLSHVSVVRLGKRVFVRDEEIERIRREGLPKLPGPKLENHHRTSMKEALA